MFVGKAGVGKHHYARALERALFEAGRAVYMLDGQNVLLGIDNDLWVDAAQSELVRRFGEVVHLLLNAGLIVVSTTNAIGLADATAVATLIPDSPMLLVDVDPGDASTLACDLRIRGNESEADVVAQVAQLLDKRQITQPWEPSKGSQTLPAMSYGGRGVPTRVRARGVRLCPPSLDAEGVTK